MKPTLALVSLLIVSRTLAQDSSDVYLFDVSASESGMTLSGMRNVSKYPGYDNQPFFHPTQPVLFYASHNEDTNDIKRHDYVAVRTERLTQTPEREYSPTVTPDGKFVSCIIQRENGAQDLGKYPIDGGEPIVLIDNLIVGYHAWISEKRLILFVLGDTMTLRHYDLETGTDQVLAENIGRSLHRIPGQPAMSFVHKQSDDTWMIKRLDIETMEVSDITTTLPGQEHLTWMPDQRILMSNGTGIFVYDPADKSSIPGQWQALDMGNAKLRGITRLAMSPDGKLLAVVADE